MKDLISEKVKSTFKKKKAGSPPGTLLHVGVKKTDDVSIELFDYGVDPLDIHQIDDIQKCVPYINTPNPTWVQVIGLHDIEKLKELWEKFEFHPLIQKDILNTDQRPKIEDFGEQIFIVLKMFYMDNGVLQQEQVSIVLSDKFVFTSQESERKISLPIKERLRVENTKMRKGQSDYMAYALIDIIVDYYFEALEHLNNEIVEIEDVLWENADQDSFTSIHKLRRRLIQFRKSVWPLRDSLNGLIRNDNHLITSDTKLFFRDVNDHIVQIIDNLDNNRELISGLHDMYMTNISNKMNEVMKLLTIIATIFIPLTFIAGIYGMNFDSIPELHYEWGYPIVWGVMIAITTGMIFYFRKKKWL